jgi:hypothetical protein
MIMWRALPVNVLTTALFVAAAICITIGYLIQLLFHGAPQSAQDYIHIFNTGASVFGFMAVIGGVEQVVRLVWTAPFLGKLLSQYIFPYLGGHWTGTVQSTFDDRSTALPIKLTVRCDLYRIRLDLSSPTTGAVSHTVLALPQTDPETDERYLWYVYIQESSNPPTGDAPSHNGAARLRVLRSTPIRMNGTYWTDRNWQNGQNTAGWIELSRVAV